MQSQQILWPVLAQIALTFFVYVRLGIVKVTSKRTGTADLSRTALHGDAWPDSVVQVSNNLRNQFESPVLFYALIFVLAMRGATGTAAVALAWAFVATRLAHAAIHMGSNKIEYRLRLFTLGVVCLIGLFGVAVHAML